MMLKKEQCRLCDSQSTIFYATDSRTYFECPLCKGIFLSHDLLPDELTEIDRYETHNNDVNDPGYQQFVSPITNSIKQNYTKDHYGLDFGSGTGPVITAILKELGFMIETYDPYFDNRPQVLTKTYDYIASCEVVEHFHRPYIEFEKLKSLLKSHGRIFIMTELFQTDMDFGNWYYKNDPTHVFFYRKQTFEWIFEKFGFNSISITGRLITLGA